ncbi:MAG TPA: lamin tail domain-containing protein [Polyangiales bacterium]
MERWIALLVCLSLCACASAPERSAPGEIAADAGQALFAFDAGPDKPATGYLPATPPCGSQVDLGSDAAVGGWLSPQADADGGASSHEAPGSSVPGHDAGPPLVPVARAGELVITELMIDPEKSSDSTGEWFELYNRTGRELALRNCELTDTSSKPHMLAGELVVAAHAYATIARSAQAGFVPSAIASFSLTNAAGRLAIVCQGTEIDAVAYDKAQGFAVATGASLQLDPEQLDAKSNDAASAWCLAKQSYGPELGTPGARNASCSDADAGTAMP